MTIKTKKVLLWCGFIALAIFCIARACLPLFQGDQKTDSEYFMLPILAWVIWEWYKNFRAYRIFVIEYKSVDGIHNALFTEQYFLPGSYTAQLAKFLRIIYRENIVHNPDYYLLEAIGLLYDNIRKFGNRINKKDFEMEMRVNVAMISFYDAVNSLGDDQYFFELIKKHLSKLPHPESLSYAGIAGICCANQHLNIKFKGGEDFRKLIEPYIEVRFNGTIYSIVRKAEIIKKQEKIAEMVG